LSCPWISRGRGARWRLDDLCRGGCRHVGCEVEEVADIVDEDLFALHAADVLAQHHDPVVAPAFAGPVCELSDILVVEPQVDELLPLDDFLLAVMPPCPGLAAAVLIWRRAFQSLPRRRIEGLGPGAQSGDVVGAQHQVHVLGPLVEVGSEGEVGVPADAHPRGVRATSSIDPNKIT
jgi:hypothetical protein